MAIKKLQHGFTNPIQSRRLLELGVPADSADCAYRGPHMPITILSPNELYSEHEKEIHDLETKRDRREGRFQICEPCWTVGRLMEIYDICFPDNGDWPNTQKWYKYTKTYNLLKYAIDCIEVAVEKEYIDFSKLEDKK